MQSYIIPGRHNIETEINGKLYSGYYTLERDTITVHYSYHSESTQKSSNNDVLANIILGQLVRRFGND